MAKQPFEPQHHVLMAGLARGIVVVSFDVDASPLLGDTHRRPRPSKDAVAFASGHGVMESTAGCEAAIRVRFPVPFHSQHKGGTAMTHEEAWIDVDWDLDFASFEWMVHLAACFNRHLPPNGPWNTWPDWPTDMIGRVPEIHRPGWLSACHLVHRHPSIAVKGNTITVTDAHGTARVLEDVDVTCRWWHVDVTSDWNVPPRSSPHWTHATARRPHTSSCRGKWSKSAWVLRTMGSLRPRACLGASDDARPRGLVQQSDRFPRRKVHLLPWDNLQGRPQGTGVGAREGSGLRVLVMQHGIVVQLDLHRSTNSVSTASTISTSRSMPVTAWAVKCRRILGPGSSTTVKGQSFSASSRPPRSPTKGRR